VTYSRASALDYVPYGLVVTKTCLLSQGLLRHTLDNWVKSGQLTAIAYGVYKRPDAKLTWKGLMYSLQRMGSDLCPGGLTVLTLQGLGHYLELGTSQTIHLYGQDKLPTWTNKTLENVMFVRYNTSKLWGKDQAALAPFTTQIPRQEGESDVLTIACPERAWFEVLLDVPEKVSFEHADQLMQGLVNLSPRCLNQLLSLCQSIKVRRLFLWFAEHHRHAWFEKLDLERYTMESGLLGIGKRVLAQGGHLDAKYLITVPKTMAREGEDG
jgi:hypothetical protein